MWDISDEQHTTLLATLPCNGPLGAVAFAPDDRGIVLTGDFGGAIRLGDAATQHPVSPPLWHQNLIRSAVFSFDGKHVLTGAGGVTRLWEVADIRLEGSEAALAPQSFPLAFSPDWRIILTQDRDAMVKLRDATTGRVVGGPIHHEMPLLSGAFSPTHEHVVTIGVDRQAHLWNLATGEHVARLAYGHEPALCAAFSRDGKTVSVGYNGAVALLWNVRTTQQSGKLMHEQHSGPVFSISYSPSGRLILTGGSGSSARLWNATTGEELGRLRHDTGCWGTFSPDGSLIVTAGTDHNAQLWDVQTLRPWGPPLKHAGVVTSAVFSADGRTVLTGSLDGTARVWDVATGKQLGPSMTHAGQVIRVGFGPDGSVLTSEESYFPPGSPPSEARLWSVPQPAEGTDVQLELWAQVVTGMELDENGGARVLEVSKLRERTERLRRSGFESQ